MPARAELARRRIEDLEREIAAHLALVAARKDRDPEEMDWKLFLLEKKLQVARTVLKTALENPRSGR